MCAVHICVSVCAFVCVGVRACACVQRLGESTILLNQSLPFLLSLVLTLNLELIFSHVSGEPAGSIHRPPAFVPLRCMWGYSVCYVGGGI